MIFVGVRRFRKVNGRRKGGIHCAHGYRILRRFMLPKTPEFFHATKRYEKAIA